MISGTYVNDLMQITPGTMGCHGSIFASTNSTYAIIFVAHHRWLVPMWSADLQRRLLLAQRLGVASAIVAQVSVRNFRDAPRIVKSCTYIHSLRQMPPEAGGVSWVDCRKHQFHLSYFRGSSSLVGSYMVC